MPAARERVRVARALPDLPQIAAAFAEGRLSYSTVRALTQVATPATDTTLLGFALYATAAQLERICRTWRQVNAQSAPDTTDRQHHQRTLGVRLDDDGCMFAGCPNTRWTDGHHIRYWTQGGPTELANLIRLCRYHHGRIHHTGTTIAQSITDRTWTFHRPDSTTINPVPPLPGGTTTQLPHGRGVQPWLGDPARLDYIIGALVDAQNRHTTRRPTHPDVPAETPAAPPIDVHDQVAAGCTNLDENDAILV